jgi:acetyl-CoA carboxylase carboxyltransferase component
VITRKAYGGAYLAMCSKSLGADAVWAWPSAEIAVMGPEGAANIIYRREIAEADEPESMRQQMIEKYRKSFAHPYIAASRGHVDGVIEPEETREQLIFMLSRLAGKREGRPSKKHGNIPL